MIEFEDASGVSFAIFFLLIIFDFIVDIIDNLIEITAAFCYFII